MDNGDILENNEEFLNNINSTLNVKRDYDMKELDYEWIDIIEDVLPYLDNILRNPKRFIVTCRCAPRCNQCAWLAAAEVSRRRPDSVERHRW